MGDIMFNFKEKFKFLEDGIDFHFTTTFRSWQAGNGRLLQLH